MLGLQLFHGLAGDPVPVLREPVEGKDEAEKDCHAGGGRIVCQDVYSARIQHGLGTNSCEKTVAKKIME